MRRTVPRDHPERRGKLQHFHEPDEPQENQPLRSGALPGKEEGNNRTGDQGFSQIEADEVEDEEESKLNSRLQSAKQKEVNPGAVEEGIEVECA